MNGQLKIRVRLDLIFNTLINEENISSRRHNKWNLTLLLWSLTLLLPYFFGPHFFWR
jgi:hypothetical protein